MPEPSMDHSDAIEAGVKAFRRELEDEHQHIEDALRIALAVAITTALRDA